MCIFPLRVTVAVLYSVFKCALARFSTGPIPQDSYKSLRDHIKQTHLLYIMCYMSVNV